MTSLVKVRLREVIYFWSQKHSPSMWSNYECSKYMILHEAPVTLKQSLQSPRPLNFSVGFEMCRSLDIEW